jgi:hypothetical protein
VTYRATKASHLYSLAHTIIPSRINLREANFFFDYATSPFPSDLDFPSLLLLLLLPILLLAIFGGN